MICLGQQPGSSSGPISKVSLIHKIYKVITPITQGFFRDESWQAVRKVWDKFNELGLNWGIIDNYYGRGSNDHTLPPQNKTWKFEIKFTNNKGKPDIIYGTLTAAGGGSVEEPLERYDLTVVMSESKSNIKISDVDTLLPGGKSRGKNNGRYDQGQISKGRKIEQEHVESNPNLTQKEKNDIAEKISRDHLEESEDFVDGKGGKYYNLLDEMEKKIKNRLKS